jgi:hypothetical protein
MWRPARNMSIWARIYSKQSSTQVVALAWGYMLVVWSDRDVKPAITNCVRQLSRDVYPELRL